MRTVAASLLDGGHDLRARAGDFLDCGRQLFGGRCDFLGALGDVGRILQVFRQLRQGLRGLLAFAQRLGLLGNRLGRFLGGGDFLRTLVGLLGGGGRLLGADGNLAHRGDDLGGVEANPVELLGDFLAVLDFAQHGVGRCANAFGDDFDFLLDLADQVLDLLGALFRGLGQGTHFVGNHREALAVLAGAGRFDGGVQGQQVGLVDAGHGLDDVADVGGLLFKFGDHAHRVGLAPCGDADVADEKRNLVAGARPGPASLPCASG
jgi:hypothetical protein